MLIGSPGFDRGCVLQPSSFHPAPSFRADSALTIHFSRPFGWRSFCAL